MSLVKFLYITFFVFDLFDIIRVNIDANFIKIYILFLMLKINVFPSFFTALLDLQLFKNIKAL